jgi:phosphoribosylanthranilate isomerase
MAQVQRSQVKICGIRRDSDVLLCRDLSVDYVGFNFFTGSKRYIKPSEARAIWNGSQLAAVGVLVQPTIAEVDQALADFPELCALQFHGDETDSVLAGLAGRLPKHVRLWQARRVGRKEDLEQTEFAGASLVLFDSKVQGEMGGTGVTFDWTWLSVRPAPRTWGVAGGVRVDNVDKLQTFSPHLVDVSSGVESAPGIKDHQLVRQFVAKVRAWG